LKPTFKLAIVIAIALTLWMISGLLSAPSRENGEEDLQALAHTQSPGEPLKVRVRHMSARPQRMEMTLQGRTEAKRMVDIKAEIEGRIIRTPVEKGQQVQKGDVLCQLAEDAHRAILAQSQANYEKALLDFQGAKQLRDKGLLSDSNIAASKAALENARAGLKIAQVNVDHLSIRAPFSGFIEDRPAEVGALIRHGEVCARLIDESSILATAQVSEKDVPSLRIGQAITAHLAGGGFVQGNISFVARTADSRTRTYRVEALLQTQGEPIRDGSTTEITVPLEEVMAYQISPAILALDDDGQMGVRLVNQAGRVEFHQVHVVKESIDGIWVSGLPPEIDLITVGQEYLANGDKVETMPDQTEQENRQILAKQPDDITPTPPN
jgi:multidrug efflux system membrane fusion protein